MKEKLDQIVIDAEFLLISVIQGVALATLASNATPIIASFQLEYWLYIVSAFLFILIFWSQAIMHVLGFIRWPLDMIHNFLYFLASLFEVMAFSQMTNPFLWFSMLFIFVLVSALLYYYDFLMIKARKSDLSDSPAGKILYNDLYKEQIFYMKIFVPLGLLFNFGCAFLIHQYPQIFIGGQSHLILVGLQVLFGLTILVNSVKTFNRRLNLMQKQTF